jgi:hypothetical protein
MHVLQDVTFLTVKKLLPVGPSCEKLSEDITGVAK